MAKCDMKSLFSLPNALKIPEFILAFTIMMMARLGGNKLELDQVVEATHLNNITDPPLTSNMPIPLAASTDLNSNIFGVMVIYGFTYLLIVQLVGILGGERSHLQNFLHALCGFFFYISVGSVQVNFYSDFKDMNMTAMGDYSDNFDGFRKVALAEGSLAIITSFVFLADAFLTGLIIIKGDWD